MFTISTLHQVTLCTLARRAGAHPSRPRTCAKSLHKPGAHTHRVRLLFDRRATLPAPNAFTQYFYAIYMWPRPSLGRIRLQLRPTPCIYELRLNQGRTCHVKMNSTHLLFIRVAGRVSLPNRLVLHATKHPHFIANAVGFASKCGSAVGNQMLLLTPINTSLYPSYARIFTCLHRTSVVELTLPSASVPRTAGPYIFHLKSLSFSTTCHPGSHPPRVIITVSSMMSTPPHIATIPATYVEPPSPSCVVPATICHQDHHTKVYTSSVCHTSEIISIHDHQLPCRNFHMLLPIVEGWPFHPSYMLPATSRVDLIMCRHHVNYCHDTPTMLTHLCTLTSLMFELVG